MGRRFEVLRLFEAEPDLLRHLPPREADVVRHRTVVDSVILESGTLRPPALRADPVDPGFLVLDGFLLRRVSLLGEHAVELLGPGDVIRPARRGEDEDVPIPHDITWRICCTTRLALLDRRFERDMARWPGVLSEILDRLGERSLALTIQLAIARMPRLDNRLLCLFWRFAQRWGRVGPDGVALSLRVTQGTLAELVAARRASVNAALRDLRERSALTQTSPGRWLLRGPPPALADPRGAQWQPVAVSSRA